MAFRQAIFWSHLVVGVGVGLFVFIMSLTGVLLTYEHKIIHWVEDFQSVDIDDSRNRLSVDKLASIAIEKSSRAKLMLLGVDRREDAPVTVYLLGETRLDIHPYSGELLDSQAATVEFIMHAIVSIHRSLATGRNGLGHTLMAASNLVLLFLIVSGLYLWFPRVLKWPFLKMNLVFAKRYPTAKARDFNWHHVFGFWCLVPLFLVVLTGVIISYPWANRILYDAYGETAPAQEGPPFLSGASLQGETASLPEGKQLASLQSAFNAAKGHDDTWTSIRLLMPVQTQAPQVRLLVNTGNGILPEQRTTLVYDRVQETIASVQRYEDMTNAQQARMFVRFLHTGEQFGFIGSTIAGLASLAACFLVYTGIALSYRRLVQPYFRRRT